MKEIEFPTKHSIANFYYNGFSVEYRPGFAEYEVKEFVEWTNDPGIGKFLCTDNEVRLIPSCQLSREFYQELPKRPNLNPFEGNGAFFGPPSKS